MTPEEILKALLKDHFLVFNGSICWKYLEEGVTLHEMDAQLHDEIVPYLPATWQEELEKGE